MLPMISLASCCSSLSSSLFLHTSDRGVSLFRVMTFGSAFISSSLNARGKQASTQATQSGVNPSNDRGMSMSILPTAVSLPSTSSCMMRHELLKLSLVVTSHMRCIACDNCGCSRGIPHSTMVRTRSSEAPFRAMTKACSTKTCKNSPSSAFATTLLSSSMSPSFTASTRATEVFTASCSAMGSSSLSLVSRLRSASSSS
mmetsp:Transcript_19854/g.59505  ORF Transcript_19854/g.59505 Transcript_19854/m.59505 type:complete len:200 (+) Transcript_19854:189-788(+)